MANELSGIFGMPQQQPSTAGRIGQFLGGFGAGVQGRGPEYLAAQQQQQQQLSMERQMAMIQDAQTVYGLLEAQQPDRALQLVDDRVQNIARLGGDPSDTLAVREMIAAGNIDGAKQEIGVLLGAAANAGLIQVPEQPEGFTLAPGAGRYDAQGNLIAQQPTAPAGDPDSVRALRARAADAGIQPGTQEYQQFMLQGGPAQQDAGDADQRERKIRQYQQDFGMTRNQAIQAVDSQTMLDDRGNLITYDPISRQGTLVDINVGDERPVMAPPSGTSLEDLAFDPAKGTGFGASFIGLWNSTVGQLPLMPIGSNTAQAAQNLRILERDAIRALGSSGRPPVIEQERIASLLPQSMDPLQNPQEAQYKMTNFVDLMMNQYVDDLRYSQDPRNPKDVRGTSAERARNIESIVRRVLTPEAAQAAFDSLNKIETEVGEIQAMPMHDLLNLNPSNLSDAQLDIYLRKMRE